MRQVRTVPRFGCDFCKKVSVSHIIAKHELRCFKNPNRLCDACQNTGTIPYNEVMRTPERDCEYCERYQQFLKETLTNKV